MTGKQLFERIQRSGFTDFRHPFVSYSHEIQAAWNQLAKEASVNMTDEFALATHQERNRL